MDQSLAEIATLGLPIHITELDVNSAQGGQRGFGADITADGIVAFRESRTRHCKVSRCSPKLS
jgi:GH35 family endo-1,4-beta-xylanase